MVRVPIGTQTHWRKIRRIVNELTEALGHAPSDEEVAEAANLPLATVNRAARQPPDRRAVAECADFGR